MSMTVEVRVNSTVIGTAQITNRTGLSDPKATNVYRWHFQGDGHRVLDGEITHRYGAGAMVLASKVLDDIALRYIIASEHQESR